MEQKKQLIIALVLLVIATGLLWRFKKSSDSGTDLAFFYDESAKKLFTAPRTMIPPIKGTDGPQEDAYRAVVISRTGKADDKKTWEIAYIEKYSPELKAQMKAAQAAGGSPAMNRAEAQEHRFVRLLKDPTWFPLSAPEAELIVTEWANPGPTGVIPVTCTP
jgi:hypothetical protein